MRGGGSHVFCRRWRVPPPPRAALLPFLPFVRGDALDVVRLYIPIPSHHHHPHHEDYAYHWCCRGARAPTCARPPSQHQTTTLHQSIHPPPFHPSSPPFFHAPSYLKKKPKTSPWCLVPFFGLRLGHLAFCCQTSDPPKRGPVLFLSFLFFDERGEPTVRLRGSAEGSVLRRALR